jgi:hypothetical protein
MQAGAVPCNYIESGKRQLDKLHASQEGVMFGSGKEDAARRELDRTS